MSIFCFSFSTTFQINFENQCCSTIRYVSLVFPSKLFKLFNARISITHLPCEEDALALNLSFGLDISVIFTITSEDLKIIFNIITLYKKIILIRRS